MRTTIDRLRPLIGIAILLALWEILAVTVFAGQHAVPTIQATATTMWSDQFYWPDIKTTIWEAIRGYLIGNGLAVILAGACVLVRPLEQLVLRVSVATYAVPTIAVGPILVILFSLDTMKVIMAALSVFFVTLVGMLVGLRSASRATLDYIRVAGGSSWAALTKVRLRAAVPSTFAGLSIAAPAAILGAIIGEYLGGTAGLGVVMVNSEASLEVSRTWAVATVATLISGVLFALTLLIGRLLAPESVGTSDDPGTLDNAVRARNWPPARWPRPARIALTVLRRAWSLVVTLAILAGLWLAVIKVFGLNPYFAKTPTAVWNGLYRSPGAAAQRHLLYSNLAITLRDAGLGYLIGTGAAIALAGSFVLLPIVESTFMPVVIVFRAVPLIAMTPLLALIFGNGVTVVVVVAAIVAFVPSVVIINIGLRSVPPSALDLMHAYAASPATVLRKVRLRYAMPAVLASARIAIPGAVLGAVLAEWLVANNGIGREMALAITTSNFIVLWGSVVLVSAVSIILYNILSAIEESLLSQSGR